MQKWKQQQQKHVLLINTKKAFDIESQLIVLLSFFLSLSLSPSFFNAFIIPSQTENINTFKLNGNH